MDLWAQLYVKCINVQYESSRTEDFYDLSVCIKGYRNVEESLAGSLKPAQGVPSRIGQTATSSWR